MFCSSQALQSALLFVRTRPAPCEDDAPYHNDNNYDYDYDIDDDGSPRAALQSANCHLLAPRYLPNRREQSGLPGLDL